MIWKGIELSTIGQACDALKAIETKEEAQEFLKLAKLESPSYAEKNIGYLFGYFDRATWKRLSGLFGISHPIFGDNFDMTDEEIFQKGVELAKTRSLGTD